jgi:hypothetical protein
VDFHRSRASAALAALLAAGPAHAACTALDGTFHVESVEKPDGMARTLTEFAADKERAKLYKREGPPPAPQGFGGNAPRARPKVTPLAATVRVKTAPEGAQLSFLDASGKVLSQAPIGGVPSRWKCVSGRLERQYQTTGGLGDNIRTEKTEQVLFAAPSGDLMFAETVSVVSKTPPAPRKVEVRFPRAAKAAGS